MLNQSSETPGLPSLAFFFSSRNGGRRPTSDGITPYSRTIVDMVVKQKVAILTSDAQTDQRFESGESIRMQQILAYETDLLEYGDVFAGSTVVRAKVDELKSAALAELIGAVLNNGTAEYEMGQVSNAMEKRLLEWLGSILGSFLGAAFIVILPLFLNQLPGWLGIPLSTATISHIEFMVFGALIVFFLIVEPHGLARLWAIGKEKLRLWPFPH